MFINNHLLLRIIRIFRYGSYLLIFLSACSQIPGGITPEEAVRKTFPSPDFRVTGVRYLDEGAIVIYHKPQPDMIPGDPGNPSFQLGFSYVDQRSGRWWNRSGRAGAFTPEQGAKVIFLLVQVQSEAEDPEIENSKDESGPLIVFGKILDQAISSVETKTEDGKVMKESVSDSMFVLVETTGTIPCELRLMNDQGEVVEIYSLTELQEWQVSAELSKMIKDTCPVEPQQVQ